MKTIEQTAPNIFAPVEKMAQQLQSFTRQQKVRLLQLVPDLRTIQPEEAVISPQLQQAQVLADCMAQRLAPIPSIEKVYVQPREWGFECWIVAQGSTLAERFQVYEEQWVLMEEEPNISFKFHLVERYDSQLSDLLTTQQMASGVISRGPIHLRAQGAREYKLLYSFFCSLAPSLATRWRRDTFLALITSSSPDWSNLQDWTNLNTYFGELV